MSFKAIILAAGVGSRLGGGEEQAPKCLLRFGGASLLQRHVDILHRQGVTQVVLATGYRAERIAAELAAIGAADAVTTIFNPRFKQGSIVTLWSLRAELAAGSDILLMDADVLYDDRLIERLIASAHRNCFLLDRDIEPGEEPVKLCIRDGVIVDFHKKIRLAYDYFGESVGFFRLSAEVARSLAGAAQAYLDAGATGEMYEEALRDVLLKTASGVFGFEDITGLPWIEIDFPEDVRRAQEDILPRLVEPPY